MDYKHASWFNDYHKWESRHYGNIVIKNKIWKNMYLQFVLKIVLPLFPLKDIAMILLR